MCNLNDTISRLVTVGFRWKFCESFVNPESDDDEKCDLYCDPKSLEICILLEVLMFYLQ